MYELNSVVDHECGPECDCGAHHHHEEPKDNSQLAETSDYVAFGTKWGDSNSFGTSGQVVTWSLAGSVFDKYLGVQSVALGSFLSFDYEAALKEAFDAWSAVSGIKFVQVNDDGTTFNNVAVDANNYIIDSLTAKGGAGDIRINAGYIDGSSGTLAYAFGPGSGNNASEYEFRGNITFDSGEATFWNYQSFVTVAMHEIGHSIGLNHTSVANSLMNPTYNPSVPTVQSDDISGAQGIYGTTGNQSNLLNLKSNTLIKLEEEFDGLTVNGSTGNDFFIGSKGSQTVDGASGNDTILGDAFEVTMELSVSNQVYRLYFTALGRAADDEGHYNWTYSIASGSATINDVIASFVASAEFTSGVGLLNNTDFVNHLYLNSLGRAADSGGLNSWVTNLNNGMSKADVILGFSQSLESQNLYNSAGTAFAESNSASFQGDEAFRTYKVLLNRDADKDGLINWSTFLADGGSIQSIADGFLASAEYQNANGSQTNEQYVTMLYQNALGRTPDAGGLASWLAFLDAGASKAEVSVGFIQSSEMITLTDTTYSSWVKAQGTDDTIYGNSGADKMAGGMLSDKFIFKYGDSGDDIVADLEAWDELEFQSFGFSQASDVYSYLTQNGDDVVFDFNFGGTITFQNTQISDFNNDMFNFV